MIQRNAAEEAVRAADGDGVARGLSASQIEIEPQSLANSARLHRLAGTDADRLAELADLHRIHIVEGLGTVIAHDLNQPLAAVILLAESALRRLQCPPFSVAEAIEDLNGLIGQARRAGAMTARLRQFLLSSSEPAGPLDVEAAIIGACDLLAFEARAQKVELVRVVAEGLPKLTGNARKLEHVLVTLIRNGIEAIRSAGNAAGRIELRAIADEAPMLRVTVTDTGPGLSATMAQRVFEPFYSTKSGGLGLGLPISRALVEQLGGRLWAEPHPGRGIFHLSLPVAT